MIENHVDAALVRMAQHGFGEVLLLIVDDDVGAERRYALHLARRRRHEQARARRQRFDDLHRRRRDSAAAAVQQHGLAVGEPGVEEQVHVRREIGFADAGCLLEAQARRNAHDVARMGRRELGVTAAAEQREHALAAREFRDARAECLDGAGGLEPEQRRFAGRRRIMALPLHDVGPVHARRVHANQDAAWSGDRGFGLPGFQHLGSAETVE